MTHHQKLGENLDKLEVLSDIYNDMIKKQYPNKSQKDIAKLKVKLVKKEMMLLTYLISQDIGSI
jgi:hypothetical protein